MLKGFLIRSCLYWWGVVQSKHVTRGCKEKSTSKRLVPIEYKVFLEEEGYFTLPTHSSSLELIPVPCPSMVLLNTVSKEAKHHV